MSETFSHLDLEDVERVGLFWDDSGQGPFFHATLGRSDGATFGEHFAETAPSSTKRGEVTAPLIRLANKLSVGPNLLLLDQEREHRRLQQSSGEAEAFAEADLKLKVALSQAAAELIGLLSEIEDELYVCAQIGGHHRGLYFKDDSLAYLVKENPSNAFYYAAHLRSFGVTDSDGHMPLHVEPVVQSVQEPDRLGFLPLGSIPIVEPLFIPIKDK